MKTKASVPILIYHNISDTSPDISLELFTQQMDYLKENGFTTITLDDLMSGNVPRKSVIITFDDGYESVFNQAFPIMKERGLKGTVYIYPKIVGKKTQWSGHMDWDQLKQLYDSGLFSVQSHALSHQKLTQIKDDVDLYAELSIPRHLISKYLGYTPNHLSYPLGDIDDRVTAAARQAGYTSGVTADAGLPASADGNLYKLPRQAVWPWEGMEGFTKKVEGGTWMAVKDPLVPSVAPKIREW